MKGEVSPWEEEGAEASLNVFSTNSNAQSNGMVCVVFVSDLVRASDDLEKSRVCCLPFKARGILPPKEGGV